MAVQLTVIDDPVPPAPKPILLNEVSITAKRITNTVATIFAAVALRTGTAWAIFGADPDPVTKALFGVGTAIYTGLVIGDEINKYNRGYVYSKAHKEGDILPTPKNKASEFTRRKGGQGWVRNKTGEIYKKSHTSHGNIGNKGDQWKVYPKGTNEDEMGINSKTSGERTTIDQNGKVIGN